MGLSSNMVPLFNVNTYVAGVTKVVLVEGAISVLPNQGDEHKIHPGELAVLNGATQDVQISKVDISPYIAWNSGRFVFDNCSNKYFSGNRQSGLLLN